VELAVRLQGVSHISKDWCVSYQKI
jgi:hypothetical protein